MSRPSNRNRAPKHIFENVSKSGKGKRKGFGKKADLSAWGVQAQADTPAPAEQVNVAGAELTYQPLDPQQKQQLIAIQLTYGALVEAAFPTLPVAFFSLPDDKQAALIEYLVTRTFTE